MVDLELLRRQLAQQRAHTEEATRALEDIKNKDGNPEAIAEIALENIKDMKRPS